MVKTHQAMMRRFSACPKLMDVAKALSVRTTRLNAVESGRDVASREFIDRRAKVLGVDPHAAWIAYLLDRKAYLLSKAREVDKTLAAAREARGERPRKSKSA